MQIDVFNGDADGICALVQLRLANPCSSELITGVKRDIELLEKVEAKVGDHVTVLDISMAKNLSGLTKILANGATIFYVDHHQPGEIPEHENLHAIIDMDASTCTSLLVNDYLQGQFLSWAVTAAFGDNLNDSALQAAAPLGLSAQQLNQLKELGICINYNGYGSRLEDLHFAPEELYKELCSYRSPFDFMQDNATVYQRLIDGYYADMAQAENIEAEYSTEKVAVFMLPDEAWARRISGVYGNDLANKTPERAHAIISHNNRNGYQVSVRAPLTNKTGADELCSAFPTGGGRKAAAGINHLPYDMLQQFINSFEDKYNPL